MIRYLSICSGIEAASVAWAPLGWEPLAFADIDPFASALLAHWFPGTPNLGDLTAWASWPEKLLAAADVLVGDSPRYRGIGNSMPVYVMRWLGERIAPFLAQ